MSESNIIKEYLIALGFSDTGSDKFLKGLKTIEKGVVSLAAAATAMVATVEAAVTEVSDQFEDLYYAAQRIGATVENIQAFSFALGQVGGSARGARAALESMGEFFRSNPGAERFIGSLGIQTRDANNQLRDMTDIMQDLGRSLRAMPYYRAKAISGVLGIDTLTLQAMMRGSDEFSEKYHQMAQRYGIDLTKATESSHKFLNDLRELLMMATLVADKIIIKFQPMADKLVNWFEDLDQKTRGWSTAILILTTALGALTPVAAVLWPLISGMAEAIGALVIGLDPVVAGFLALAAVVGGLVIDFNNWKAGGSSFINWGEWSDQIDGITKAFKELWSVIRQLGQALAPLGKLIMEVFDPIAKFFWKMFSTELRSIIHSFLAMVTSDVRLLADALRVVIDLLHGDLKGAMRDAGQFGKDAMTGLGSIVSAGNAPWLGDGTAPPPTGPSAQSRAAGLASRAAAKVAQAVADAHDSLSHHVLAFFTANGIDPQVAAGINAGRIAEGGTPTAKSPADARGRAAFGIGQWRGPRLAALIARYGPNPTLDQQLEFMLWELRGGDPGGSSVLSSKSASQAGVNYLSQYMRPGAGIGGDLTRLSRALQSGSNQAASFSGSGVSITQNNTNNIYGEDPHKTASLVSSSMTRHNGDLIRNLRTVVS